MTRRTADQAQPWLPPTFLDSLAGTFLLTSGNHGRDQSDHFSRVGAVLHWREVADATLAQGSRTGRVGQAHRAFAGVVVETGAWQIASDSADTVANCDGVRRRAGSLLHR